MIHSLRHTHTPNSVQCTLSSSAAKLSRHITYIQCVCGYVHVCVYVCYVCNYTKCCPRMGIWEWPSAYIRHALHKNGNLFHLTNLLPSPLNKRHRHKPTQFRRQPSTQTRATKLDQQLASVLSCNQVKGQWQNFITITHSKILIFFSCLFVVYSRFSFFRILFLLLLVLHHWITKALL